MRTEKRYLILFMMVLGIVLYNQALAQNNDALALEDIQNEALDEVVPTAPKKEQEVVEREVTPEVRHYENRQRTLFRNLSEGKTVKDRSFFNQQTRDATKSIRDQQSAAARRGDYGASAQSAARAAQDRVREAERSGNTKNTIPIPK